MDTTTKVLLVFSIWGVGLLLAFRWLRQWNERRSIQSRLATVDFLLDIQENSRSTDEKSGLALWLIRAGYRRPDAVLRFLFAQILAFAMGFGVLIFFYRSPLIAQGLAALQRIPGGAGDLFYPILAIAPWLVATIVTLLPMLVVRTERRQRVQEVEQDLPLFLELLATLSESGLGFDAAIDRLLIAQPTDRVLANEFRQYQREMLTGFSRISSLRRLGHRIDVTGLTAFISALVQAEQVGTGVASVLRTQAEDARNRRRERSLALASTLPTKLLFPLVICFLPGLFVATLGPTFNQFFQFADNVIRNKRL